MDDRVIGAPWRSGFDDRAASAGPARSCSSPLYCLTDDTPLGGVLVPITIGEHDEFIQFNLLATATARGAARGAADARE